MSNTTEQGNYDFKVGQTVSIPLLPDHGKGIIYAIAPPNKSGYRFYIQFSDRIGKSIMPGHVLKAELVSVKTAVRSTNRHEEDEGEEIYLIEDSASLQDFWGEMPSYNL